MKQIPLLVLAITLSVSALAQPKFEVGLITEGSWVNKNELQTIIGNTGIKSSWGTGMGMYVSIPVWWHFSVSSGLKYRYSGMQKGVGIYSPSENGDGTTYLSGYNWIQFPRHYVVVPAFLRLIITRNFYITGGLEACWLLNYEYTQEKPEYNRAIGFGSRKHKLNWTILYIEGLKSQCATNHHSEQVTYNKWFDYQTRMLQLNLSYPLWQKK